MPPPVPAPAASSRFPIVKFLADYNPFYLLSACCMLFGVFAMNNSLDWSPTDVPLARLLVMIVTLNVYEALLIGLAVFLLGRGIRRDAMILMVIEAFFLADVGFLNMEVVARSVLVGVVVNALVLAAAAVKVAFLFRAARVPFGDGRFVFVVIQLGVLFAVPGIFAIAARPYDQHLSMSAVYLGWWLAGLLPVAYAVLVGSSEIFRKPPLDRPLGSDVIISRVLLVLPMLSLVAHLCLANWVYKVAFHPLNFSPLLLGLAVAIGHCDRHLATIGWRMRMQLALPFCAIGLSAIRFPAEMVWQFGVTTPGTGFGVSPLRVALLAAAAVYLDGLYLFRHAHFAWAAGLCVSAAGMGHSVASINDNSLGMAKTSANAFDRLVPRTLFAWGFVSVVAAFVLLGLGALMSMIRKDGVRRVVLEEKT